MNTLIKQHLKNLALFKTKEVTVIRELANSITSNSYLLNQGDKFYVMRIDKIFNQGVVPNRKNEVKVLNALSETTFSNKLIYSNEDDGILLTEYIKAAEWTEDDIQSESQLTRLAKRLKQLHKLEPEIQTYDLIGGIKRYAKVIQTKQADIWASEAIDLLARCNIRPAVLCHNDLHINNIIESDEIQFIDWEYSGLGNPLFDIAGIIQTHQLDTNLRNVFLNSYFESITRNTLQDINRFRRIHDLLLALWLSVLIKSASSTYRSDIKSEQELHLLLKRL